MKREGHQERADCELQICGKDRLSRFVHATPLAKHKSRELILRECWNMTRNDARPLLVISESKIQDEWLFVLEYFQVNIDWRT